ncbi:MAG: hypothetical protein AAFN08_06380, partial [Cyanobacteria bacterium J06559_3]
LVPAMVLSVIGFRVLLGPAFLPLILCHVFWIRWWPEPKRQGLQVTNVNSISKLGKGSSDRLTQFTRN